MHIKTGSDRNSLRAVILIFATWSIWLAWRWQHQRIIWKWRYQWGNQRPFIQGQTIQWSIRIRTKGQTMIYKTLHRKIKIEQHEHHTKHGNGLRGSGSALVTPGCYSCYIFGHKSRRKKGSDCDYDKRNISVFICDVSQMLNTFFCL